MFSDMAGRDDVTHSCGARGQWAEQSCQMCNSYVKGQIPMPPTPQQEWIHSKLGD